jgi:predicted lipoprotein with Yx(FWY)xxD motif
MNRELRMNITKRTMPAVAAAVALAGALAAAGCGSSSSTKTASAVSSAASSAASTASNAAASATVVKVTHGSAGAYLTDGSGRALYLFVADHNGKSSCSGACAAAWPPLTTKGTPKGSSTSAKLTTITRSDGTKQVVYNGHPLYRFAGDTRAGSTSGQGSSAFGAKWWLVTPAGAAITSAAPSSSSSSVAGY